MNELYYGDTRRGCPVCGIDRSRVYLNRNGRELRRCDACQFAWVPQGLVREADGTTIYEHDPPIFLTDGNADYYLDANVADNARVKLGWVVANAPRRVPLLDVGANFGHFVAEASAMYDATGLELSPTCVAWARSNLNVELQRGSIDDDRVDFRSRFGVVTAFDVLEHVADPRHALTRMREFLVPGGYLFITTPDTGSVTARAFGTRWYHYDLVQHVGLFNRRNLTNLLSQVGFTVRGVRTFGRTYRLSYIERRLHQLATMSAFWWTVHVAALPLRRVAERHVSINLGDVMGIVAQVQ